MKIACLQFAPELGQVQTNIAKADELLGGIRSEDVQLLILPELAFSGYNFLTLSQIEPFLEPTSAGVSTTWAKAQAAKLGCVVIVGYPETCTKPDGTTCNYNSTVTVAPSGHVLAHYRKSFLYYTDATWAVEGTGFGTIRISEDFGLEADGAGMLGGMRDCRKAALGICMDINPYNFTAAWDDFEFANHLLTTGSKFAFVSMAWLSHTLVREDVEGERSIDPDLDTLSYWIERFKPVLSASEATGKEFILAMANRCGVEGEVCYAGTSTVMVVRDGNVGLLDILGKGVQKCMLVDTDEPPKFVLKTKTTPRQEDGHEEKAAEAHNDRR